MSYEITLQQAKPLIEQCLQKMKVPYLASSPGLGKTSLMRQIAEDYNLELIIVNLGDSDPTDFKGLPFNLNNEEATFLPFDDLPVQGTKLPKDKKGWLIFLDELPSASRAVMASSHKLVLDRLAGNRPLHDLAFVAAAGNLATDNTHFVPMTTPLASRMVHFQVKADLESFLKWGIDNNIHNSILSFLRFRPDLLHKFDKKLEHSTFPCPRTWADLLSPLIEDLPEGGIPSESAPLIMGTIGSGAGAEFIAFRKYFEQIPTLDEIISDPRGVRKPAELGLEYALTSMLTSNITLENADKIMEFMTCTMGIEMQATLVLSACRKNNKLIDVETISNWIDDNFERFQQWEK